VHCGTSDEVKRAKEIIGEPAVRMSHRPAKRRWILRRSVQSDEAREESSKDSPKARIERGSESFLFFLCALKTKWLTGERRAIREIPERQKDAVNADVQKDAVMLLILQRPV